MSIKFTLKIHQQKKIILHPGTNGGMSVIDVVPLESSDSSDSQILVAESLTPNGHNENGQQVTAQGTYCCEVVHLLEVSQNVC